jgi:hypothetical protein
MTEVSSLAPAIRRFIDLDPGSGQGSGKVLHLYKQRSLKILRQAGHGKNSHNLIKSQVTNFPCEVPCIVTLRNPGMRGDAGKKNWER